MSWSLKSIGYWFLLILSFAGGVFLTGYSLFFWTLQKNHAWSIENVVGLSSGVALLMTFFIYFQDRKYFPLKKMKSPKEKRDPSSKMFASFFLSNNNSIDYPTYIELSTNIDGLPILLARGAPSPIRFEAVQINQASDRHEEDYKKTFYNIKTGEVVRYDKARTDHQGLYEHFLWIINPARKSVLPKSYMEQYNLIESESKVEKRAEILH